MTSGVKKPVIPSPICILRGVYDEVALGAALKERSKRDVRERIRAKPTCSKGSALMAAILDEEIV